MLSMNFVTNKIMNIKKNIDLQSQPIYVDNNNFNIRLHILRDIASGVPVSDIEQVIVQNVFKIQRNYIKLMIFYQKNLMMTSSLLFIMSSRNMKKRTTQVQNI